MSRSRKKHPAGGACGKGSEKWDKREYNRRLRKKVKSIIKNNPDLAPLIDKHDVSDLWSMSKDGKMYYRNDEYRDKYMRK